VCTVEAATLVVKLTFSQSMTCTFTRDAPGQFDMVRAQARSFHMHAATPNTHTSRVSPCPTHPPIKRPAHYLRPLKLTRLLFCARFSALVPQQALYN
jgi:hypothetical protein